MGPVTLYQELELVCCVSIVPRSGLHIKKSHGTLVKIDSWLPLQKKFCLNNLERDSEICVGIPDDSEGAHVSEPQVGERA